MVSKEATEADALVNGDRQDDYGSPAQNYADIALVWTGLLGKKLNAPMTAADAATMMVGLKLARQMNRHKHDNIVDAHGYLMVLSHILAENT